jgi:hypothetical protein
MIAGDAVMIRRTIRHLLLLAATLALLALPLATAAKPPPPEPTGRLQINSDPAKAEVLVDRQSRGKTPLTIPLTGTHLIAIRKEGYLDAWQTVTVPPLEARALELQLEPLRGLLLLQSNPTNADVTAGGLAIGRTPLMIDTLPLGTHRIRFLAPGYQPKEIEVQLPDRTPVRRQVDLLSNSATLTVETDAEGASIRINGLERGTSPCTADRIPEGETLIEIRAPGYTPLSHKIRLAAGETQQIKLPLTAIPAFLRIVSIPDKARVYINNEPRGQTPLEQPHLAPGKYRIRVEAEGFDPNARDVTLTRGDRKIEEFRLLSNAGRIDLITEPEGVTVLLDGRKVGETKAKPDATTNISEPLTIEPVLAGEHELRLVRKGYAESKQTVQIETGKIVPLQLKLVRRYIPDCLVVTMRGVEFRGVLESDTAEAVRMETAPGVMTTFPRKDVKYLRAIREDGTLE